MRFPYLTVTQALVSLIALSLGSTAIAYTGAAGVWIGLAILALAWIKAQVILRAYLGLQDAEGWARGFGLVLAIYMIGIMILAVAAG